jgi:hypothetical protein
MPAVVSTILDIAIKAGYPQVKKLTISSCFSRRDIVQCAWKNTPPQEGAGKKEESLWQC